MKYKSIIKKEINAVSPVIATILMVCLVVAVVAPMVFMINSMIKDPDPEGLGSIIADLHCPCDLFIKSSTKPSINYGYTNAGVNRILNTNMQKATLEADDGEKERYRISEVPSNKANDLLYQVTCWDDGKYDLTVEFTKLGKTFSVKTLSVMADDIDIEDGTIDTYQIIWRNPPTVIFRRDKQGDGTYEIEMTVETATITNTMIEDGGLSGDDGGDCGEDPCERYNEDTGECEWRRLDLDHDGFIGPGDFAFFAGCFGGSYSEDDPCYICNFDGDPDGIVGTGDFGVFSGCFGLTCSECTSCWSDVDPPSDDDEGIPKEQLPASPFE